MANEELMNFELPVNRSSIIKVIGVGGGGSNAVNHMWKQGIKDVDFVVCNTDNQALRESPVPVKIQIGANLTNGLGVGNNPEKGKQAALESLEEITEVISKNTKMLFITAGMGGGTGTGAAPIIARAARELGILTVAIVTIPFRFEGQLRVQQAIEGINELRAYVDSLLVINNEKLREIYGDLKLSEAFARADNVLSIAAKGIAEIITVHGYINVDFADVETVMRDSGVAILGSGSASGEGRALRAIQEALASPLLNNNSITGADSILLNITSGVDEVKVDEVSEITDFVTQNAAKNALLIWGTGMDESLGEKINITIIATGFETNSIPELYIRKKKTDRIKLEDHVNPPVPGRKTPVTGEPFVGTREHTNIQRTIEFDIKSESIVQPGPDEGESSQDSQRLADKVKKLRAAHEKIKSSVYNEKEKKDIVDELENEPAYVRKKIKLDEVKYSTTNEKSKFTLTEDEEKNPTLREDNPYLHDRVD
jgi:cell division protein FtsZ